MAGMYSGGKFLGAVMRVEVRVKVNIGHIDVVLLRLVKLPTTPPEDILNDNHKQLRGGKGSAAHQQTTNFIYMITRPEISRRTDCGTFEISDS